MMFKRKTRKTKVKPVKPFTASPDEYFTKPTKEEVAEIHRILEAKNCFEVLDVDPDLDLDEKEDVLREKYLSKCLLLKPNEIEHPKLDEAYKKLMESYDILSDPQKRASQRRRYYGGEETTMEELFSSFTGAGSGPILVRSSGGSPIIISNGGPGNMFSFGPMGFFAPTPTVTRSANPSRGGGFLLRPAAAPPQTRSQEHQQQRERHDRVAAERERMDRRARRRTQWEVDSEEDGDDGLDLADMLFGNLFGPRRPRLANLPRPRLERGNENTRREQRQRDQTASEEEQQNDERESNDAFDNFLNFMAANLSTDTAENTSGARAQPTRRPPPPPRRNRFEEQLQQLSVMGFNNRDLNRRALELANGNVQVAANILLNQQSF